MAPSDRTKGTNQNKACSLLISGNFIYYESDGALAQVVQEGCEFSLLGHIQKPLVCSAEQLASSGPP